MKNQHFLLSVLSRWLTLLILAFGTASVGAQQEIDPPARVASLSAIEGSVVFAPAGETEWVDAMLNRPITRGDRLWTDRGARAELHVGSAALHLDHQTFLDVTDLDDDVLQVSLNEGTVNARVRELMRGENFEIDTPQLAFRASRPGDFRLDVDPAQGTTRVTVRSGSALVYGANGQAQELVAGQGITFAGTNLERVNVQGPFALDGFDRWAADRNRAEDESIAARYVPRDVVGYHQLDAYGNWAQDPSYGAVWYPRITVVDWAPYRYGHWEFIAPWGWTWVDDAPWGFAPFHYGRWAMIGSRWAWVPGRLGPRPVYAPALVVFVGGSGGVSLSLSFGSGSGIGWFPLGPGEVWRPYYRTSPRYVTSVNRYIVINNQVTNNNFYINQRHPSAVTAVPTEDFSRGRPVHRNRRQVDATELDRVRIAAQPTLPEPRRIVESRPSRTRTLPPPTLSAAPAPVQPQPGSPGAAVRRRDGTEQRSIAAPRPQLQEPRRELERDARQQERVDERQRREAERDQVRSAREQENARREQQERLQRDQQVQSQRQQDEQRRLQQTQREQEQAAREQERAAREQDRARRDQQLQQERVQREQQERVQRGQQERAQREQERVQREQQLKVQRDNALRQQQAAQEQAVRQQQAAQEQAQRQQQQAQERAQRQAQEQMLRQQQQQQRQEQQQQRQEQRAARPQPQPQAAPAPEAQQAPREGRGRPEREQREDKRSQGGEEGGRGRGQGRAG